MNCFSYDCLAMIAPFYAFELRLLDVYHEKHVCSVFWSHVITWMYIDSSSLHKEGSGSPTRIRDRVKLMGSG